MSLRDFGELVVISSGLDRWSSRRLRYRLVGKKSLSLAPSLRWPGPVVVIDTNANEGPAITSIEYKIDPRTAEEFLQAVKEMRLIRQRDGAIRWNLLRDTSDPEKCVGGFITESGIREIRPNARTITEGANKQVRPSTSVSPTLVSVPHAFAAVAFLVRSCCMS